MVQRAVAVVEQVFEAHEVGDETRRRRIEDGFRRGQLLDAPAVHDDDAVGQSQRFFLVMRHVQHGDAQFALDAAQLGAHLHAQLGVQVRQRLIEQQQGRFDDDGARQRHALLLAAGHLRRQARFKARQTDGGDHGFDLGFQQSWRNLAQTQTESDVVVYIQVREQGIRLEDHADIALVRRQLADFAAVEHDAARLQRHQAGDRAHGGGLAAAAGAQQRDQFALLDVQVQVFHGRRVLGVAEVQLVQFQITHRVLPLTCI